MHCQGEKSCLLSDQILARTAQSTAGDCMSWQSWSLRLSNSGNSPSLHRCMAKYTCRSVFSAALWQLICHITADKALASDQPCQ